MEMDTLMHEPDFWTQSAEAMELSIEGERLIAGEVADLVGDWWRQAIQGLEKLMPRLTHRHRPSA
jgi:hypothetical protein